MVDASAVQLQGAPEPQTLLENHTFYRPEMDALRFVAFLLVFIEHTFSYSPEFLVRHDISAWIAFPLARMVAGGALGVDLFFALSAYLITELLLREKHQRGTLDVKAFYIRRVLRIWPLYCFFLFLAFAIPYFDPEGDFSARYLAMFLLLSGNWGFALWGDNAGPLVFHLWSIAVEEQFYLLWPPIVARLTRLRIVIAAAVLIAVANIERYWQLTRHGTPHQLWWDTFAHLDSIAIGILVSALLMGKTPRISVNLRWVLIIFGLICFLGVGSFRGQIPGPPPITLSMLACSVIVVLGCLSLLVGFIGLKVREGWLTYLGKISYGLYVWHTLCVFLVFKVAWLNHAFRGQGVSLALTVAVAAMSYSFLEKPFLRLKQRFTHIDSRPV
jgi:peptidoglycan/LPS O-acetylase OafA/YrhL